MTGFFPYIGPPKKKKEIEDPFRKMLIKELNIIILIVLDVIK